MIIQNYGLYKNILYKIIWKYKNIILIAFDYLFFSPEFVGNEYVGFNKEDDIRLDVQYLGIEGLVDFLQMHIGMHGQQKI